MTDQYAEKVRRAAGYTGDSISESFRWLTPEIKSVIPIGKNKVRVKAVAARADEVSLNNNKYLKDELVKSVNTLIGKPVVVNHNPNDICGNVELADWEDNELETVFIVNKHPYIKYLLDHDPAIRGVSMGADYYSLKCTECKPHKHFFKKEDYIRHMAEVHLKKNIQNVPYGIQHKGLSLVISPETPGLRSATASTKVLETKQQGFFRLCETVINEGVAAENVGVTRTGVVLTPKKKKLSLGEPKDEHGCEPWEYWDGEKCVKKTEESEEIPECPEGEVYNPATGKCESAVSVMMKKEEILQNCTTAEATRLFEAILTIADKNADRRDKHIHELEKMFSEEIKNDYANLNAKLDFLVDISKILVRNHSHKINETEDITGKLAEITERVTVLEDNAKAQLRGQFKGHAKVIEKSEGDTGPRTSRVMRETAPKK